MPDISEMRSWVIRFVGEMLQSLSLLQELPGDAEQKLASWYQAFVLKNQGRISDVELEMISQGEPTSHLFQLLDLDNPQQEFWAEGGTWIAYSRLLRQLNYSAGNVLAESLATNGRNAAITRDYVSGANLFLWLNVGTLNKNCYQIDGPVSQSFAECLSLREPKVLITGSLPNTAETCHFRLAEILRRYKEAKPDNVLLLTFAQRMQHHSIISIGDRVLGFPHIDIKLDMKHHTNANIRWVMMPREEAPVCLEIYMSLRSILDLIDAGMCVCRC